MQNGLPTAVQAYSGLLKRYPHPAPLSDTAVAEIGGAAYLFLLFARLCEPGHSVDPETAMRRAVAALVTDPEIDADAVRGAERAFGQMMRYNVIREDATIWECLVERCLHVTYPGESLQTPSAFHGFLETIAKSYEMLRAMRIR